MLGAEAGGAGEKGGEIDVTGEGECEGEGEGEGKGSDAGGQGDGSGAGARAASGGGSGSGGGNDSDSGLGGKNQGKFSLCSNGESCDNFLCATSPALSEFLLGKKKS